MCVCAIIIKKKEEERERDRERERERESGRKRLFFVNFMIKALYLLSFRNGQTI